MKWIPSYFLWYTCLLKNLEIIIHWLTLLQMDTVLMGGLLMCLQLWDRTHYADKAGLEIWELLASTSQVLGWKFLQTRTILGQSFWLWSGNPIPPLDVLSFYWRWTLQVSSSHCRAFHLRSSLWVLRVSHLPGLWCILEGSPNLLFPEVACFHSFCWPSGLQSFSFTQYQIRFPSPPSPDPIHFPSQVSPSLPTCDCFLHSPSGTEASSLGHLYICMCYHF